MTPDKELQYQARIRELREALASAMSDLSHQSTLRDEYQDFSGIIDGITKAFSRTDDLSALEAYVREEKRKSAVEVLLGAATICNAADKSTHPSDLADIFKRMAKELK